MKRYLVTGATSGLGEAVYEELGNLGIVDTLGRQQADFSTPRAVTAAIQDMTVSAPYDGIFHCAGSELVSPLRLTADQQYREVMAAADSAFGILRAAACKGVMSDGASIVLMSSVAAQRGAAGMAAYSACKAAIDAMARGAAIELASRRIRVNSVAAGGFRSPMHDRLTRKMANGTRDAYAAAHPLGIGGVDAVADVVLFLLSDAARWVTGTSQVVDGGFLA